MLACSGLFATLVSASTLFVGVIPDPPSTALVVEEFGPQALGRKAASAAKKASRTRQAIAKDASRWVKKNEEARPDSIRAFRTLLSRWVPEAEDLAPSEPASPDQLAKEEQKQLEGFASELSKSAKKLLTAELGGAAGFEAYRALGLHASDSKAGKLLEYEARDGIYQHPREVASHGVLEASASKPESSLQHVVGFQFFEIHTDISPDLGKE